MYRRIPPRKLYLAPATKEPAFWFVMGFSLIIGFILSPTCISIFCYWFCLIHQVVFMFGFLSSTLSISIHITFSIHKTSVCACSLALLFTVPHNVTSIPVLCDCLRNDVLTSSHYCISTKCTTLAPGSRSLSIKLLISYICAYQTHTCIKLRTKYII